MLAVTLLRAQGDASAKALRGLRVPDLLVDQWHQAWALMVADAAEDDEPVMELLLRVTQAMAIAGELASVYGNGKA